MDKKKRYIWAFPGTGKSSAKLPFAAVDADSERFKFLFPDGADMDLHQREEWQGVLPNPDYPSNYFHYLDSLDADVVFINCHLRFLEEMDKENIIVVYPSEKLKEAFLRRYADRGDSDSSWNLCPVLLRTWSASFGKAHSVNMRSQNLTFIYPTF